MPLSIGEGVKAGTDEHHDKERADKKHASGGTSKDADNTSQRSSESDIEKGSFGLDDDCAVCHLAHAQTPVTQSLPLLVAVRSPKVSVQAAARPSHIADAPERPDRRLA